MPLVNFIFDRFFDLLTIKDSFSGTTANEFSTQLTISDSFTGIATPTLIDSLNLRSSFTYATVHNRTLSTLLDLRNDFNGYIESITFIGSPIPTLIDVPGPVSSGGNLQPQFITVYFPPDASTPLGTWLGPELQDKNSAGSIRINRYSRDQGLIIFNDPEWGFDKGLTYTLDYLTELDKVVWEQILRNISCDIIKIIDHNGVPHIGFISTPEAEFVQSKRGGYTLTFSFVETTNETFPAISGLTQN